MSGKSRGREGAGDSMGEAQGNRVDPEGSDRSRELNVCVLFFFFFFET